VVKRRRGTDITLNETFQQFAGYHYYLTTKVLIC
jgi:hypothetical protein